MFDWLDNNSVHEYSKPLCYCIRYICLTKSIVRDRLTSILSDIGTVDDGDECDNDDNADEESGLSDNCDIAFDNGNIGNSCMMKDCYNLEGL